MEYKKQCKTCGKVYCYTEEDLKNNTQNAAMSAISAVGSIASVFGGTIFHTAHLTNQTQKYNDKIVDYDKCPYCNSVDVVLLSDEEFAKVAQDFMGKKIEISTNATPESLVERAELFLEDEQWNYAIAYADACLDMEPKNAYAYVCKLLAELHIKTLDNLSNSIEPFDCNDNFIKAERFGDEELKTKLNCIADAFCKRVDEEFYDSLYREAREKMYGSVENYETAIKLFREILDEVEDWKDSRAQIEICEKKIKDILETRKNEQLEKEERLQTIEDERKRVFKRNIKISIISVAALSFVIALFIILGTVVIPANRYSKAVSLQENGEYIEAIELFRKNEGYKDSKDLMTECYYNQAVKLLNAKNYEESLIAFKNVYTYKDSSDYVKRFRVVYDRKIEKNDTEKTTDYIYDTKGNLIKETIIYNNPYRKYVIEYTYDENKNIVKEMSTLEKDGSVQTNYIKESVYNGKKCIKDITTIDDDKNICEYVHDESGKIIKSISYDEKYGITSADETKYGYDGQGNLVSKETYGSDGTLLDKEYWEYDAFGRKVVEVYVSTQDDTVESEYIYDECGNLTQSYHNGSEHAYYYDKYGNLAKDDGSSSTTSYIYEGVKVYFE